MKTKTIILMSWLICSLGGAQTLGDFEKANLFYNEGAYLEAIRGYEAILEKELHSAELYYNLANCYYKINKVGPCIYYYEKALGLEPKDQDILNNFAFAQKMTVDKIDDIPDVGFLNFVNNSAKTFSLDNWAFICVCFMLLFVSFFIGYYLNKGVKKKRLFFVLSALVLIVMLGSYALMIQKNKLLKSEKFGVLFSPEVLVRSEPNLKSELVIKLHEGTKIQLLETYQKTWTKIKLRDGKTGWVSNEVYKEL
tara:strand:- start:1535 stop:2290 length:756 start_codon:yes stop_codon:yes gene_type:complete